MYKTVDNIVEWDMLWMYEDDLMELVVFCGGILLCALCIPKKTPSARWRNSFHFPCVMC